VTDAADTLQNPTDSRERARWEKAFLKVLRRFGNVTKAASAAKVDRAWVYEYRKLHPDFDADWKDALDEAADHLEAEAWKRAVNGVKEPVYQGGILVGHKQVYSDSLMALLLKAHKPEKYRDRTDITSGGEKLATPIVYLPEVDQDAAE
jgi:hypothetical protein